MGFRRLLLSIFLFALSFAVPARAQQTYADSIAIHRAMYRQEFITEERSPLKAQDTGYLRFFRPDEAYRVRASIVLTHTAAALEIPTHSGKTKTYRPYGIATFVLKGRTCSVHIYQSTTLIKKEQYRKHLFLPFNDLTNYEETYGGGRYLDLSTDDIVQGWLTIDFNKCYNPYCAYASGYSCPVPPVENRLGIRIEAGEQNFAGTYKGTADH